MCMCVCVWVGGGGGGGAAIIELSRFSLIYAPCYNFPVLARYLRASKLTVHTKAAINLLTTISS